MRIGRLLSLWDISLRFYIFGFVSTTNLIKKSLHFLLVTIHELEPAKPLKMLKQLEPPPPHIHTPEPSETDLTVQGEKGRQERGGEDEREDTETEITGACTGKELGP